MCLLDAVRRNSEDPRFARWDALKRSPYNASPSILRYWRYATRRTAKNGCATISGANFFAGQGT